MADAPITIGSSDGPPDELVAELMGKLGEAFDLSTVVGGLSLGEVVEERIRSLNTDSPPQWGGPGSMAQVAERSAGPLAFYYRPHLFPEMDPALKLGHQLQFDLLPRALPETAPVRITAVLESYCHLSGDLVGWHAEEGGLLLWIADVSGHGVRAGLAAAVLQFLTNQVEVDLAPGEVARRINERMLSARNPEDSAALFATAFWIEANAEGKVSYASAGHNPALLRLGSGEIKTIGATGRPIGLLPDQRVESRVLALEPDDTLLVFTDGLVEALSPGGEEFGLERVASLLADAPTSTTEVARAVYDGVQEFKETSLLDDDLTLLVVQPR